LVGMILVLVEVERSIKIVTVKRLERLIIKN
jgi:hypothetical protein